MTQAPPPGERPRRSSSPTYVGGGAKGGTSGSRWRGESATDVDEIVADDAGSDPALDALRSLVATAIESVAPLHKADTAFAPGSPFLAVSEPALLLQFLSLRTLGGAVGNGQPLHA